MSEILFPGDDLLSALAIHDGAPAGGSVAGVVVALAAALVGAAADRSRGEWPEAAGVVAQAAALRRRAGLLARQDVAAYAGARAALAGEVTAAGNTSPQRDWALGRAVAAAADPPLALAGCADDLAQLAATLADRGAPDVRADAVVAAQLAASAAAAAAHLVRVNLVVGGDERMAGGAAAHARSAAAAAATAAEA